MCPGGAVWEGGAANGVSLPALPHRPPCPHASASASSPPSSRSRSPPATRPTSSRRRVEPVGPVVGGVDFGRLFAEPTDAQVAAVEADWAARDTRSSGARIVGEGEQNGVTYYVVEHQTVVADGPTVTHYGVVRVPEGADDAPVLVVHHGGDDGVSIAAVSSNTGVGNFAAVFRPVASETVQVFPVYRSETIDTSALPELGGPYTATGDPSPWDYDVDDAIALLDATLELFDDETDADRVATVGLSRGANVAVLHGIRDDRVDAVVDYYGPTDFYNDGARQLAIAILGPEDSGSYRQAIQLPGAAYLLDEVLAPLRGADGAFDGTADYDRAQTEIVRRSPGFFADRLPSTQVHHHYRDGVVPFVFSTAFAERVGGAADSFELFLYGTPPTSQDDLSFAFHAPEGSRDMLTSVPRVLAFLSAELDLELGDGAPAQ